MVSDERKPRPVAAFSVIGGSTLPFLQGFDTVGWAIGRASIA